MLELPEVLIVRGGTGVGKDRGVTHVSDVKYFGGRIYSELYNLCLLQWVNRPVQMALHNIL